MNPKNSLDGMAGRPYWKWRIFESSDRYWYGNTGRVGEKDVLVVESYTIIFQFRIYLAHQGSSRLLPDILATGRNRFQTSRKMEDQGMSKIQVILTHWVCVYETTRQTFFLGEIPCCHLIETPLVWCVDAFEGIEGWRCGTVEDWCRRKRDGSIARCQAGSLIDQKVKNQFAAVKFCQQQKRTPAWIYMLFSRGLKMEAGSEYNF